MGGTGMGAPRALAEIPGMAAKGGTGAPAQAKPPPAGIDLPPVRCQ